MRISQMTACLVLLPCTALGDGYGDLQGVRMFSSMPCEQVIEAIDSPAPTAEPDALIMHGLEPYGRELVAWTQKKHTAWGFILGFDQAKGGLHHEGKTTLERLRTECEIEPDRTALEILEGL